MLNKVKEWHQSRDYLTVQADVRRIGVTLIQTSVFASITHIVLVQIAGKPIDARTANAATTVLAVGLVIWIASWPSKENSHG